MSSATQHATQRATENATMNTIIHAAFRRDLVRFGDALGTWPAGSASRAGEIATAWDNFALQLRRHHDDEETIFWPVLRALGASDRLADELETEHAGWSSRSAVPRRRWGGSGPTRRRTPQLLPGRRSLR